MDEKGIKRRGRLILIARLLLEKTDDRHSLTLAQIQKALSDLGVEAERKSLYRDLETLRAMDMDIITERSGRQFVYYVGNRRFELAELKTLVDAVQASRFITAKKSMQLIQKLEGLTSTYEAKELSRQVTVSGRLKTGNEGIYYNVDQIHRGIAENRKLSFQYFQWTPRKKKALRHNGAWYSVSPWALLFDNENYYLVGYDDAHSAIRHYRVDKITNISLTEEKRAGKAAFRKKDVAGYSKSIFGMFEGEPAEVALTVGNDLIGVFIDRFGDNLRIKQISEEISEVRFSVKASDQFMGWIIALDEEVEVLEPAFLKERLRAAGERLCRTYR